MWNLVHCGFFKCLVFSFQAFLFLRQYNWLQATKTTIPTITHDALLRNVFFPAKIIIFWSVCHPDDEKPQVGNITISDVSWDSFSVSWELEKGEVEGFLIEVSDPDGLSEGQNHTLSSQEFSLAVTDLSPSTFYRVTLYGLFKGDLLDPVFAEAITGITKFWTSLVFFLASFLFQSLDQMLCLKQQHRLTSCLF